MKMSSVDPTLHVIKAVSDDSKCRKQKNRVLRFVFFGGVRGSNLIAPYFSRHTCHVIRNFLVPPVCRKPPEI